MFVGHFAGGVLLKSLFPTIPSFPIMAGIALLDVLNGIFGLAGLSTVTPNLNAGPYIFFDLTFIDWDHSLLMSFVWSTLWGTWFAGKDGLKTGLVAFVAAISHEVEDYLVHNNDLAAYPYSHQHYGLSLWSKWGTWSWVFEGVFAFVLAFYATRRFNARNVSNYWVNVALLVFWLSMSPITSPLYYVAQMGKP